MFGREYVVKAILDDSGFNKGIDGMKGSVGDLHDETDKKMSGVSDGIGGKFQDMSKKTSDGIGKTQDKLDGLSKKSTDFGKTFTKGVTAPIIGGIGGMFAYTMKMSEGMDNIAKSSERLGVSTDFYQQGEYWAGQNGIATNDYEKAVGRLNQRMGLAAEGNKKYSEALERMGFDMEAVQNGTISTEDAFEQSIEHLKGMTNEQEKAALASELFGVKLSRELMPALNDGALSIEEAKRIAEEFDLVIDEETLNSAELLGDTWDDITRSFGIMGMQLAGDLMPVVQDTLTMIRDNIPEIQEFIRGIITGLSEGIGKFLEFYGKLSPEMQKFVNYLGVAVVAIGPLALAFGGIVKMVSMILTPLKLFTGLLGAKGIAGAFGLVARRALMFLGPIGVIISVIWVLANHFDKVKEVISSVGEFLVNMGVYLKDAFTSIKDWVINDSAEMFNGVVQWIVEMKDKVINTITGFVSGMVLKMIEMRDKVIGTITGFVSGMVLKMFEMRDRIIGVIVGFVMGVVLRFINLRNTIINTITGMVTGIYNRIVTMRDLVIGTIVGFVQNVWDRFIGMKNLVFGVFGNIRDGVYNRFIAMRDLVVGTIVNLVEGSMEKFRNMRDRVFGIFGEIKDNVKGIFDNIVEFAVTLPERIGDGIRKGVSFITDALKSMGNSMASTLKNIVNSVLGGFNTVLGVLGIEDGIPLWDGIKEFSRGTGGTKKDGLITVGDKGPGNYMGGTREIVEFPDGRVNLFERESTFYAPRGTKVLSNRMTEQVLRPERFSGGTVSSVFDWLNEKAEKVKEFIGDPFDAITKSGDWVGKLLGRFTGGIESFSGLPLKLGKGLLGQFKGAGSDYLKGKGEKEALISDFSNALLAGHRVNYKFGLYPPHIARQLGLTHHYGVDTDHVYDPVRSPVSGRVLGKTWDRGGGMTIEMESGSPMGKLYHWFMHMSDRKVNPGDYVKKGQVIGTSGNTGQNTTGAHLHYQLMKNGIGNNFAVNPMPYLTGGQGQFEFYKGGLIGQEGMYRLGETGDEMVIPLNDRQRAFKLLQHVNRSYGIDGRKNKTTDQLPNVGISGDGGTLTVESRLLKALLDEFGKMSLVVEKLLTALEDKDFDLKLDGESIKKAVNKKNDREENMRVRGKRL